MKYDDIKKYFDLFETNLKNVLLVNKELSEQEKEGIDFRLFILNEMKNNFSWHTLTAEEKQIGRIRKLAIMRRAEGPPQLIEKQKKAIDIYEQIYCSIPYLEAIDSGTINMPIIKLCTTLSNTIDFAGSSFKGNFPKIEDIEKAFEVFFEVSMIFKNESSMFKECYEKIEYLYKCLKKLSEV